MKKNILWVAVLGVLLLAGNSWAVSFAVNDVVKYANAVGSPISNGGEGGSFNLYKSGNAGDFLSTFCIELDEWLYPNMIIVDISTQVYGGGKNSIDKSAGMPLSSGAAKLYSQYYQAYEAKGVGVTKDIADAYQMAIWRLEGEITAWNEVTNVSAAAGLLAANLFQSAEGAQGYYGVQVLNLKEALLTNNQWVSTGKNAQSLLVYVPEPATMLLLGFGLLGLAGISRRRFKS